MNRNSWRMAYVLLAPLALAASAGSAFAAAGDVVNSTYRGLATNSVLGSEDCRAMTVLPRTGPAQEDRPVCSSRAAGTDGGIDGVGGLHVLHHSGSDWIKGNPISSDETDSPENYPLCPFTNADDVLGVSLSYLGNLDLDSQDSVFGYYYHDMSVGVKSLSGTDEQWIIWFDPYNGDFEPKGCIKLTFSTVGLNDGLSEKIVNVGDHDGDDIDEYCTANESQILCFEFDGLAVDPTSEVLIESATLDLYPLQLALASSNGKLFVTDSVGLSAVTFDSGAQFESYTQSIIDDDCKGGLVSLTEGEDLDANGVPDLLLGNWTDGVLCALFMQGDGNVHSTRVVLGEEVSELLGSDIVAYGDNGDGTCKVLASVPLAEGGEGGFMEIDLQCGAPVVCGVEPSLTCLEAPQASWKISKSDVAGKHKMQWKWQKGSAFDQLDLGNPLVDTVYTVCVYDEKDGVTRVAGAYEIPAGATWSSKDPKGLQLKDNVGSPEGDYQGGVTKVKIKTGDDGKTQVQVGWNGANFTVPEPAGGPDEFFSADPAVTIQLHNSATSTCWSSSFSEPFKLDDFTEGFQASFKP